MSQCEGLETDLSPLQARAILEPLFDAARETFAAAGHAVDHVRLEVAPWVADSPRHYAACAETGRVIYIAPEAVELPVEIVVAIFHHELGHAVDFSSPATYWLGRDGALEAIDLESLDDTDRARRVTAWSRRDDDVVERVADAIASAAAGAPIGYLGPCKLQCFGRGQSRPDGLR